MSWSVNDIYELTKFLTRKNQSGGISSTDLFYSWNAEQSSYFSDLLGRFQKANNSKLGADTGLIENETIMTKLTPFTAPVTIPVVAGQAIKPTDFVYALALRCNGAKIYHVDHDTVWAVNQDVIDPPSLANNSYYYTEYLNYFSVLPATVTSIDLDYIQAVTDIKWDYTFDINNRQVYNPGGATVQPKWTNNSIIEITKRALINFGVSFASQDFENFGRTAVVTGD
jgi:hypothetical protein